MGKKIITVKLIERDGEDEVLDEYEIGSWDMLTEIFNECLAEIVKRFVDSMSTNHEACVDIVEQLLEMKESLKAKYKNSNKNAW